MVVLLFEVSPCSKASMDSLHLHYPPSVSSIRLSYPSLCNRISLNQSSRLALGIHNPSLRDPPIKSIHQASSFEIHNPSPRDLRNPSPANLTLWNPVESALSSHHPSPPPGFLFIALRSFILPLPWSLKLASSCASDSPVSFSHSESLS